MIFQYTWQQVINEKKTQTRRVIRPDEIIIRTSNNRIAEVLHNNRAKWRIGQTYAVQPGRGKHQIARIEISRITRQKVNRISTRDAILEGFQSRQGFLKTWEQIHGQDTYDYRVWVIEFILH